MEDDSEPQPPDPGSFHVALMGDSVLDDFYWLSDPNWDVRVQLVSELKKNNPNHRVSNWAVDESTIHCVLYGSRPRDVYVSSRAWRGLENYPTASDGNVYPLHLLGTHTPTPTHVVLSIGGNDARVAFSESFDLENIYRIMIDNGIEKSLRALIQNIIKKVPKLILVYVYHPQITMFPMLYWLPPEKVVTELLIKFSPIYISVAKDFNLPVIDLSRTFNPYDSNDYGTTPIEPSNKSGMYIAKLVEYILEDFKFGNEEKSKVYWGIPGEIQSEPLANWTEEVYREKLQGHILKSKQKEEQSSLCNIS